MAQQKQTLTEMLSQPPLLLGVSYVGIILNAVCTSFVVLVTGDPVWLLLLVTIHLLMRRIVAWKRDV